MHDALNLEQKICEQDGKVSDNLFGECYEIANIKTCDVLCVLLKECLYMNGILLPKLF